MRHELGLKGSRFALRPAGLDDARFIADLRSNPRLNHYLGGKGPTYDDQIEWMRRYETRPGDWYFVIMDGFSDAPVGTIAIYDHDPLTGSAEWGRWILAEGSLGAVESVVLMFGVAFDRLGLTSVYSRTNLDNRAVVSFHDSCRFPRVRVLNDLVASHGMVVDAVEHRVDRATWASIAPRLEMLAARLTRVAP